MSDAARGALTWILGLGLLSIPGGTALAQAAAEGGTAGTAQQAQAEAQAQAQEETAQAVPGAQPRSASVDATSDESPAGETPAKPRAEAEPLVATVAAARFTSGIENREPVDAVTFLENEANKIYFFTDLRQMKGETVTHRWEYQGQVMAEIPFEVKGQRWRVWSSKNLQPDWLGEWTVSVVRSNGEVVASENFTYQAKP